MQEPNFDEVLVLITNRDQRFHRDAYLFVREALDHTQRKVHQAKKQQVRHVTGQELLEGIREFALIQYGPLALTLLTEWGVTRCEDFGEIVFNLVESGLLSKTEEDSRKDFTGGYDFQEAFRRPFLPKRKLLSLDSSKSPKP
jgi:uncharacterized repeat protein (TIGR04138 family)